MASNCSTHCRSAACRRSWCTSPTRITGCSNRRTRCSGTRPYATGWQLTHRPARNRLEEMNMKRRTLLKFAAAGTACAALPAFGRKIKPLKILVLGGTRFIGLHMTALALERGHTLTFFNRGKTHTDKFPEVERIKGDRNGEIDGLKNRQWDVVID